MARYLPADDGGRPVSLPPKLSPAAIRQEKRRAIVRNPFALLLHNWRLKRIRWAMAKLNRRLAAYEEAYGTGAFQMTDDELRAAGVRREPS